MQTQPSGARVPPSWLPPCVVGGRSDSDGDAIIEALELLNSQIARYATESPDEAWATLFRWKDYLRDASGSMDLLDMTKALLLLEDIEAVLQTIMPGG